MTHGCKEDKLLLAYSGVIVASAIYNSNDFVYTGMQRVKEHNSYERSHRYPLKKRYGPGNFMTDATLGFLYGFGQGVMSPLIAVVTVASLPAYAYNKYVDRM